MTKFRLSSLFHLSSKSTSSDDKERKKTKDASQVRHNQTTGTGEPGTLLGHGTSRIKQLADKIADDTAKLDKYMSDNNLPFPGFGVDEPADFPKLPPEIQRRRMEVLTASAELSRLVNGPKQTVRWMAWGMLTRWSCRS